MKLDLQSRTVKATIVLDPKALASVEVPNGLGKVTLSILAGGRTITAEVNAKSLRRCVATIAENGPDGVAVVLQGKLEANDTLLEAGIAAQPKTPKATPAPVVSTAA
jgi:hypothetical protein